VPEKTHSGGDVQSVIPTRDLFQLRVAKRLKRILACCHLVLLQQASTVSITLSHGPRVRRGRLVTGRMSPPARPTRLNPSWRDHPATSGGAVAERQEAARRLIELRVIELYPLALLFPVHGCLFQTADDPKDQRVRAACTVRPARSRPSSGAMSTAPSS